MLVLSIGLIFSNLNVVLGLLRSERESFKQKQREDVAAGMRIDGNGEMQRDEVENEDDVGVNEDLGKVEKEGNKAEPGFGEEVKRWIWGREKGEEKVGMG